MPLACRLEAALRRRCNLVVPLEGEEVCWAGAEMRSRMMSQVVVVRSVG